MSKTKKIRQRHEIPVEDTWAVEDLFPSDEAWEQALATIENDQNALVAYAGKLGESGVNLCAYLTLMEQVDEKISLLANYASRRADVDTRDAKYQAMSGKFRSAMVALGAACSFETPEIMAIEDDVLEGFYAACPGLERYRRYLTNMRRRKAHTLSAAEEKLLASAGEVTGAPSGIYGMFANADITFPNAVDSNGKEYPLAQGNFVSLEENPDRALRKSAYENLYHSFAKPWIGPMCPLPCI